MANQYHVLSRQKFSVDNCQVVPIRLEDRYLIMKWRNEQLFHLRQSNPLSKKDQDHYFNTVVANLFKQEEPDQILFSYLMGNRLIGYGGLVHINWVDQNAEISFLLDTSIIGEQYEYHLSTFLTLIGEVARQELTFHKIYTYAFDMRPEIYPILEKNGFKKEAILKEHCYFNDNYIDVIIHAKLIEKETHKHIK